MAPSAAFRFVAATSFAVILALTPAAQSSLTTSAQDAAVDQVFAKWNESTPGCSVGAAVDGRPALAKAFGMSDLEHGVPNTPDTIFEAGSVAKQFTAAAMLLLARDGKLSLDDPARKYVPELPDYGTPLTIRHMLTHTSGLRDWGSVASIAGWPRTKRVHTHGHVLDIVTRQRSLNFSPGARWSYSNTGYNLAAIIVSRVSGMSFAEFTAKRIFQPLGMTHTSWRDDYTRVVRNRAIAYEEKPEGFHTLMPFENVHGNGGLLTTVGDLLKWNRNFDEPTVGDLAFVHEQQRPGRFSDGREHDYALGLMIGTRNGARQVSHSGSTAGYTAYLARYPDERVSVAVLCNIAGPATQYAHAVADIYLAERRPASRQSAQPTAAAGGDIDRVVGLYRDRLIGTPLSILRDQNGVRSRPGGTLIPVSPNRFVTADGQQWEVDGRSARVVDQFGTISAYDRVTAARPTVDQLKALEGTYVSDEAETTLIVAVEGESLVLKRRPDTTVRLDAVYADAFDGSIGLVIFRRDQAGRPVELSVVQPRVWDMRFTRRDNRPVS